MKLAWVAVALVACKREQTKPPPAAAPTPVAAVADATAADAPNGPIDLTRAVPVVVRVSSTVNNRKILPKHIADHDLGTAWNSATGELDGSWLEVELAAGGTIEQLRMTAGFTGYGPKHEDYFTMNPRIAKVTVAADDGAPVQVALDPARRDLQTIAVHATKSVRIVVAEVVPGSKKNWREVSVSELEVWGTPPAGWTAPAKPLTPTVFVAPRIADTPCAGIEQAQQEFEKAHAGEDHSGPGGDDHAYPPDCEVMTLPSEHLGPPWAAGYGECNIGDRIYGPKACTLVFVQGANHASFTVESSAASSKVEVTDMVQQDVIAGGAPELIVHVKADDREYVGVCRAVPLACSDPIQIADDGWRTKERFADGQLELDVVSGKPPADVPGPHALFK